MDPIVFNDLQIEALAESVLLQHKATRGGLFNWLDIIHEKRNEPGAYAIIIAARNTLISKKLIEYYRTRSFHITQITHLGRQWKSFEEERRMEQNKTWRERHWKAWGVLLYFGGIFSGILTLVGGQRILDSISSKKKDTIIIAAPPPPLSLKRDSSFHK